MPKKELKRMVSLMEGMLPGVDVVYINHVNGFCVYRPDSKIEVSIPKMPPDQILKFREALEEYNANEALKKAARGNQDVLSKSITLDNIAQTIRESLSGSFVGTEKWIQELARSICQKLRNSSDL